jgi:hypothetical protein
VYLLGSVGIFGTTSEFRYLSTNTGIFDGSKGGIVVTPSGGAIDFQNQSSPTKFIGTLSSSGFYAGATLKSDIYVTTFSFLSGSGLLQTGSRTVYVSGNISAQNGIGAVIGSNSGVVTQPTIELIGTANCNFSCIVLNANIKINKGPLAIVTVTQSFTYGTGVGSPYTFEYQNGIMNFGATTMSILSNCNIINPPSVGNFSIANIIIGASTLTITNLLTVTGTLTCSGSSTFAGTRGFTCENFSCTAPASIITLQNITTNAEYIVNGVLTILGTLANRITLQAAGFASFNGTITPVGQLNYLSGTVPQVGMTLSQATGFSPTQLNPANRPVITSVIAPGTTFGITPPAGGIITPQIAMRAGYKAKFTLTNNGTSSQNVTYAQTQDIDSSAGVTILSFASNGDDVNNSTIALFRTLNWGPLVAPSGSVYYTFVS